MSTTDVLRTAIRRFYADVHEHEDAPFRMLEESGFIGCAEGPRDLARTYKEELAALLEDKA